jgi:hypothetical protein
VFFYEVIPSIKYSQELVHSADINDRPLKAWANSVGRSQKQTKNQLKQSGRFIMKTVLRFAAIIFFCLCAAIFLGRSPEAAVYKYQDENGVWHFSDAPPDVAEDAVEQMVRDKKVKITTGTDLQKQLSKKLPAQNKIEHARIATVLIKIASHYGSGFFITDNGYIVTNKYVVHEGAEELVKVQKELEIEQEKLDRIANRLSDENFWLEEENAWLMETQAELERIRRLMGNSARSLSRAEKNDYNEQTTEYNVRLGTYSGRKSEYGRQEQQYNNMEATFQNRRYDYDKMDIKIHSQRECTVILADETKLIAEEVAVSDKHDLLGSTPKKMSPRRSKVSALPFPSILCYMSSAIIWLSTPTLFSKIKHFLTKIILQPPHPLHIFPVDNTIIKCYQCTKLNLYRGKYEDPPENPTNTNRHAY